MLLFSLGANIFPSTNTYLCISFFLRSGIRGLASQEVGRQQHRLEDSVLEEAGAREKLQLSGNWEVFVEGSKVLVAVFITCARVVTTVMTTSTVQSSSLHSCLEFSSSLGKMSNSFVWLLEDGLLLLQEPR